MYNLKANYETAVCATLVAYFMEKYSSGRRGAPAKGVGRVTGAEVQIFSSPPKQKEIIHIGIIGHLLFVFTLVQTPFITFMATKNVLLSTDKGAFFE